MRRVYLSGCKIQENFLYIKGETLHYVKNVLRLVPGDVFAGFDGSGWEYILEIKNIHNSIIETRVKEKRKSFETESCLEIILCLSLTKNRIFDRVIEKAAEIGVKQIVPVQTTRSIIEIKKKEIENKMKRWRKILSEGSKVSGRPEIPDIIEPLSFKDAVNVKTDYSIFFWEQAENPLKDVFKNIKSVLGFKIKIFIGPEGGFTQEEAEIAKNSGFFIVSLGKRVLRVETAATVALGIILYQYGVK
ncbi:MAG: 16S rRNA (uracil(1498)-N(3))-methyltransferase [Candidatus Omnitrophica bacterium]|nr:16S rRNA (uracil(1498)-N(3))-methyltransferase [Candidatus Omnitrophota bacterium]